MKVFSRASVVGGRTGYVNAALICATVLLAAWTAYIWGKPSPYTNVAPVSQKTVAGKSGEAEESGVMTSYSVIVERDLFKESRRKFVHRPAPPPPVAVVAPPPLPVEVPRKPPPRLTLIGTVLLDNTNAAIIEHGGRPATYKTGDSIEDFVIRIINPDYVLMEREGETLRVGISSGPTSVQPGGLTVPRGLQR